MASALSRREARIRKILENSESRLRKIMNNNDNSNDELHMKPIRTKEPLACKPGLEKTAAAVCYNPTLYGSEPFVNNILSNINQSNDDKSNSALQTLYENPVPDSVSVSEVNFDNFEEKPLMLRNWIIVMIALVVRYIFLINEQYDYFLETTFLIKYNVNKIFIPFFAFEIVEFIFFTPYTPQSSILNMLLLLNRSFYAEYLRKAITSFRIIARIIGDLLVYIFTFVCFDQILTLVLGERTIIDVP